MIHTGVSEQALAHSGDIGAILITMKVQGFKDTIDWYNQNAKKYAQVNAAIADFDQIEEFASLLPKVAKILDAGCAAGRDSNLLQQKGFKVTGVDISTGLLEIAKQKFPHITFLEGNFLSLPFKDGEFDGVWAHQSLLHLETTADVDKALAEFHRVLKPGGVLLVLVKAQTGKDKTAIVTDDFSNHDRFFQYFTHDEIKQRLERAGFKLARIEQYKETDKNPEGRSDVELILSISKKV